MGRTEQIPVLINWGKEYNAMKAEYRKGCPQRDSVEREGYAGAQSVVARDNRERDNAAQNLLRKILRGSNLLEAMKRVKGNKGAAGIDGMAVDELEPWCNEHGRELVSDIWFGRYKPNPVRRKEIPKADGGVRKLGIPTVVDRMVQQAIAQVLQPMYEGTFYNGSYGYRVGRSGQQAMKGVKEYAENGYKYVVEVDLSKYFDTLNHDLLLEILRRRIKDKKVIDLIKKFLKSGVMDNGLFVKTEEGSPQGGPLSPLLANIYLNEFDQEMSRRGVNIIRYADDIIVTARSKRAAERLLETSRKYLEGKLRLKLNMEKSKVVSVYSPKFKFLGFALAKNKYGVMIRAHKESLKKAKAKLKQLTKRNQGRNVRVVMNKVKMFASGWLNYYCIASMKRKMQEWDEWLRRRFRQYIWKQWKKPKTRISNLKKLGIPENYAGMWGNTRLGYWRVAGSAILKRSITNEKLVKAGYYELASNYELKRLRHYGI